MENFLKGFEMNIKQCPSCKKEFINYCGHYDGCLVGKVQGTERVKVPACCPDCGESFWIIFLPIKIENRNVFNH